MSDKTEAELKEALQEVDGLGRKLGRARDDLRECEAQRDEARDRAAAAESSAAEARIAREDVITESVARATARAEAAEAELATTTARLEAENLALLAEANDSRAKLLLFRSAAAAL